MSYSFAYSFRAGSGWNCSSILILLAKLHDIYHFCIYTGKLLMMDKGTV
jgi:hypothetical protein